MRDRSLRFLMPMWEGGGTKPPMLGVARRLIALGHQVHVLGDPTIRREAEAAGCGFRSWQRAPHRTSLDPDQDPIKDWETTNPLAMLRRARDVFVAGPAADQAADTLEAAEALAPDAVLPDAMLLGAILGAQAAGLPVAPLVPNIWMFPTPGLPVMGPGFALPKTALGRLRDRVMGRIVSRLFDAALPTINRARATHGLAPLSCLFDQVLGADRVFVLSSAAFDFAAPLLPDHVRYLGPILDDPPWAAPWKPPWPEERDEPLVLVGFSSTFQNQAALLRRVVEALSSLPLRALVTLGEALPAGQVASTENVAVVRSAPHGPVLREAALVVSHCGHGTTMKALAAGVPMVCIPMGRDQNDTAVRVVHHQAGIRLPMGASASRIRTVVARALQDERLRAGARRMAEAIAEEGRAIDVAGTVEEWVDGAAPVG